MMQAVPKQFIELEGKPVLIHTVEKFRAAIPDIKIIIALAKELTDDWKTLCEKHNFTVEHVLAEGGETRYHSVKNSLALVPEYCTVGIHDAARPLVSTETILRSFKMAEETGNACPVIPVTDSLRVVKGNENRYVDRSTYCIVQTPQCFHAGLIKQAFLKAYKPDFTDDASVLESFGEKINLVEGNKENIKITTPQDLIIAASYMKNSPSSS